MVEGGGVGTGGLPGGVAGGGLHVAGSGPDNQGGWGLLRHWPSGGGVECGDGDDDPQLPLRFLHCLPQRLPWFPGGS